MTPHRFTIQELIDVLQRTMKENPNVKYVALRCDTCKSDLRLHRYEHIRTLDEIIDGKLQ